MRIKPGTVEAIFARDAHTSLIGIDGMLPWTLSEDMKHFKAITADKVVVMGRSTYDSIHKYTRQGLEPLPGRYKIVLTKDSSKYQDRRLGISGRNTTFFSPIGSIDDAFEQIMTIAGAVSIETDDSHMPIVHPNGAVIIGGATIYEQFLSKCDVIHETIVYKFTDRAEFDTMVASQHASGIHHSYDFFTVGIPADFKIVGYKLADPIPFIPKIEFITHRR